MRSRHRGNSRLAHRTGLGSSGSLGGGVGGWNEALLGDSQGGLVRNGDGAWLADIQTDSDGDNSRGWAVGGVASHGNVSGDGGDVGVSSQSRGGQSRQGSESRELHCSSE